MQETWARRGFTTFEPGSNFKAWITAGIPTLALVTSTLV